MARRPGDGLARKNDRWRKAAWSFDYRGRNATNNYWNYAPRAWFGPYDGKRFDVVDDGIEKAWKKRFLGKTFTVKCRVKDVFTKGEHPCYTDNPGGDGRPPAAHIGYGTINFCRSFFSPPPNFSERGTVYSRARTVVHEVFHHLSLKNGAVIMDTHVHCDDGRCKTEKMYNREKATHLTHVPGVGDGHYKRAIRNNDNYAYFIYFIGRLAHEESNRDHLSGFPAPGFKFTD